MSAITWWNMVDNTAYQAPDAINNNQGENRYLGGLLNNDMTEKPSYKVLYDLIHHEWTTDETLEYEREGRNQIRTGYSGNSTLSGRETLMSVCADFRKIFPKSS